MMIAVITILALATLLCLAFNSTRLIGIAGIVILLLIYPVLVTVMHVFEGITSHFISPF
ncbi:MAG: hypothetical protein KGN35_07030 [Betaproteobacteria bacterium]|nr:hypothetical protein [Betaproteobacteria bacterium]